MKLLTHNLLRCNVKGVKTGYPLKIEAVAQEVRETELNVDFLRNVAPKLEWGVVRAAAMELKATDQPLPEAITPELLQDEAFLKVFHHVLLEVVVVEGNLVCPESGRKFPIKNGIPNMLLSEDEV